MKKKITCTIVMILLLLLGISEIRPNLCTGNMQWLKPIMLTLAFSFALIGELLPTIPICLITILLLPLLGITADFPAALSGFSNSVVAFVVASCGIAAAFSKTLASRRILLFFIKKANRIETMIGALMLCAAITSSVMSNIPTCVIYMSLGIRLLDLYSHETDRKKTGKTILLGVTLSSMIGGIATPVGSSINILALQLLAQYTGSGISFLRWTGTALPVVLIMLPVCWWLLVHIFKPAPLDQEAITLFADNINIPKHMSGNELRFCLIMAIMLVLWIAASWAPGINVILVALAGCIAFQLPIIGVIKTEDFLHSIHPDAIFLIATVLTLGNVVADSGFSLLLESIQLPGLSSLLLLFLTAVTVFAGLLLLPVAPSLITVLFPGLVAIGATSNVPVEALVIISALCAGNCYLLPFDTVCQITYTKGYYSIKDMAKIGALMQVSVALTATIFVYAAFFLF